MLKRYLTVFTLMLGLIFTGVLACGPSATQGLNNLLAQAASLEITSSENNLQPGDSAQLTVVARDADGNVLGSVTATYDVDFPEFVSVKSNGHLEALYPGTAHIVAQANGIQSAPLALQVNPPENLQNTSRLTDNNLDDDWGANNSTKMTARRVVLWRRILPNLDQEVRMHDVGDNFGDDPIVANLPFPDNDPDFMALGSGAGETDVMASFRVNNMNTMVSDDGDIPVNLGDENQEENSIAEGCFFYREGGGFNDIKEYTFADGVTEPASQGELYGPIGSLCQALWEKRFQNSSDLIFFDGTTTATIATGLVVFPQYDFRLGIAVYQLNGDIYMVDTRGGAPFTTTPLTQDGMAKIESNPKTDGNSIVWRQVDGNDEHIILYDIPTGQQTIISSNTDPKLGLSLEIDFKQVIWKEGNSLYFHDGTGDASGTFPVDLDGVPMDGNYLPHLSDGVLTWIGNDGDTEVFIMI